MRIELEHGSNMNSQIELNREIERLVNKEWHEETRPLLISKLGSRLSALDGVVCYDAQTRDEIRGLAAQHGAEVKIIAQQSWFL